MLSSLRLWTALLAVVCLPVAARAQGSRITDHTDLSQYEDAAGQLRPIRSVADWERRRQQIVQDLQRVMGDLPRSPDTATVEVEWLEDTSDELVLTRKLIYGTKEERVPAYLLLPKQRSRPAPAMLCLHQTTPHGKDEPVGRRGDPELRYARELAERGYIALVPDYPSLGEHAFDLTRQTKYQSGSMKAIRDNRLGVDLLCSLPDVDAERIGVIGHSLGGHNAMFTAVFEPRIKVVVSSCGFTTLRKDDVPSWTGPRYMPRIASEFGNDARQVPFDFQEIVAAFAPRPFLACAAERDSDFDVSGVRDVMSAAGSIYKLYGAEEHLVGHYPPTGHAFPAEARQKAYAFLDRYLRK